MPRMKPPFGGTELIYGHPLVPGLEAGFLLNEGSGRAYDIVRRRVATPVTGNVPAWSSAPGERKVLQLDTSAPADSRLDFTGKFSLTAKFIVNVDTYLEVMRYKGYFTTATDCGGYAIGSNPDEGLGAGIYILHRNNNQVSATGDSPAAVTFFAGRTLGQPYIVTGTVDLAATTCKLYINGVLVATNTATGSSINYTDPNAIGLQIGDISGAGATNGELAWGFIHKDRILNAQEVAWMHTNMLSMFRDREQQMRRMYVLDTPGLQYANYLRTRRRGRHPAVASPGTYF